MKKRFLSLFCVAVLLAGVILPVAAMAANKTYYVYTSNGKTLNMRRAPVTHTNNLVTHIPFGAKVTVERYEQNHKWAYVGYNGMHGYVMTRFLVDYKPARPTPKATPKPTTDSGKVDYSNFQAVDYDVLVRSSTAGGFVNLRWGPSKKTAVQKRVPDTTLLHVIAENGAWAQVVDPITGTTGFMMKSFLVRYMSD